jgi:hypothetical protein
MPNTKVTGDLIAQGTIHSVNLADGSVTATKLHNISTDHISEGTNLFYTDARVSTYLSSNNYITSSAIANSANWDTAYSWGDHALVGYLTTETDPVFTASAASAITSTQITNWDTAYGWGNHATQSYATETYVNTSVANLVDSAPATLDTLNELSAALGDDPNFATTVSASIGTKWTQDNTKISNWDTAYSWGNHASAGYLTSLPSHNHDDRYYTETEVNSLLDGKAPLTGTGASGTWGISITGNAGTATSTPKISRTAESDLNTAFINTTAGTVSYSEDYNQTNAPFGVSYFNTFSMRHQNPSNVYGTQFSMNWVGAEPYTYVRVINNNLFGSWRQLLMENVTQGSKYFGSGGDIQATIFYDSNNTGYYLDPSSRSILADVETRGGINLRRDLGAGTGISFYTPGYHNWQIYMSPAGVAGSGANANLTAPSGLGTVTSWALRSRMEGVSTYGWLWETGSSGGGEATASTVMELGATTGTLRVTGDMIAYASDERLKTNIKPIDSPIEKVKQISGVSYDWVDNIQEEYNFHPNSMHEVGVLAQEVQKVLPEAVMTAPMNAPYTEKTGVDYDFLTVKYERIVPLLIEAIKELSNKVEELENKLNGTD